MIALKPGDVSLTLDHVPTCQCRYVIVDGVDVKMIDVRCISAYVVPDIYGQAP